MFQLDGSWEREPEGFPPPFPLNGSGWLASMEAEGKPRVLLGFCFSTSCQGGGGNSMGISWGLVRDAAPGLAAGPLCQDSVLHHLDSPSLLSFRGQSRWTAWRASTGLRLSLGRTHHSWIPSPAYGPLSTAQRSLLSSEPRRSPEHF